MSTVDALELPPDNHSGSSARPWATWEPRRRVAARTALVALAVVFCYHTSLASLMRGITVDTPLAYLGLVPVIAAVLGWYLARPAAGELDIHDRHLDLIIGIPLVATALAALILLPPRLTTMYWLWRIDLLTMPLFVAGVISLAFGARMLWRTKVAVAFLFLAWPIPFRGVVTRLLEPLGDITARAVGLTMKAIPLAVPAAADGVTFEIPHRDSFLVTIASACSGANGLVGFLLIGSALALALDGPRSRKLLWLAAGLALVWVLNVARIVSILAVGRFFGETAAIEVLHPVVGLLSFNVAAVMMLMVVRRFGLSAKGRTGSRTAAVATAVPHAGSLLAVLLVLSMIGGAFNHQLVRYDPVASSVGETQLLPFKFGGIEVPGGRAQIRTHFEHGRRFFGESSTWVRYSYRHVGKGAPRSNIPVVADVINTDDLQSFSDFGIEACYRFHGFSTSDVRRIDLGHGIRGNLLRWTDSDTDIDWVSLYWIWPVRNGEANRYERVVLLLNEDRNLRVTAPELPSSTLGQLGLDPDEPGSDELDAGAGSGSEVAEGPLVRSSTRDEIDRFMAGYAIDVVEATVRRSTEAMESRDGN